MEIKDTDVSKIVELLKQITDIFDLNKRNITLQPLPPTPLLTTPPEKIISDEDFYNRIVFENPDISEMWLKCKLDDDQVKLAKLKKACNKILAGKYEYYQVQLATGVPWRLVGAIHYRESDFDFNACLHNGQPFNKKTTLVPIGRGPWTSWQEAAIDAIKYDGLDKPKSWDIPTALQMAEKYNGTGYRRKGITSPYVWSFTNMSNEKGEYITDGKFTMDADSKRCGVAAIFKYMELNGIL